MSALLGLVPLAYSWALDRPSPSGSALASLPELGLRPLATSHPSGRPSPSLSAFVISVPWFCSSALVNPSPSQSAPPSDGSRGSVPSPDAADADIKIIRIATNTLRFFRFIFFISPIFLILQRTRCSLFPGQPQLAGSSDSGSTGMQNSKSSLRSI